MGGRSSFEMDLEYATIKDMLLALCEKYGGDLGDLLFDKETKEVSHNIHVFINGRHVNFLPNRLDTKLKNADELSIFPPAAGG